MKKLLPLLIAALMIIPTAITAQTAKTRQWKYAPFVLSTSTLKGDVNGDGDVNITDVALMVNHILGTTSSSFNETVADLNNDEDVNVTDVVMLVDIILNGDDVPDLELSTTAVVVTEESATVEIISGSGNYELTVSNPDVIDASLDGTKVIITSKVSGTMEVEVTQTTPANAPRKAYAVHHSTVIVKDKDTGQTANINVTITEEVTLSCPDDNHPHIIDLGLPSGTKWACCNVEATTPEDYGGYFAWGETEEKSKYTQVTYQYCTGNDEDGDGVWYESDKSYQDLGNDIAGTGYDVAHVKWGGYWTMPSADQIQELIDNCTTHFLTKDDVNGMYFTGPNDCTIFLPAAGFRGGENFYGAGSDGYYLSSTKEPWLFDWAYYLNFNSDGANKDYWTFFCFYGFTVRPVFVSVETSELELSLYSVDVIVEQSTTVEITSGSGSYEVYSSNDDVAAAMLSGTTITIIGKSVGTALVTVTDTATGNTKQISVTINAGGQSYLTCPDDHHPHMIDLGLPSGTKWACCNVGADNPASYGGYYAWGETEVKDKYTEVTYLYCTGNDENGDELWYESNESYQNLGSDIAGTEFDVAHEKWGGSWMMPSADQIQELIDNCTTSFMTKNGANGMAFFGPSCGMIFLPAAGYHNYNNGLNDAGSRGDYWSSTQYPSYPYMAYSLGIFSHGASFGSVSRDHGLTVRPVSK